MPLRTIFTVSAKAQLTKSLSSYVARYSDPVSLFVVEVPAQRFRVAQEYNSIYYQDDLLGIHHTLVIFALD